MRAQLERAQRGRVQRVETDDTWGLRLEVELADGRLVPAQPWFPGAGPRGDFYEVRAGDVAICLPMEGLSSDWVALVGGSNGATPPPDDVDNVARVVYGSRVEIRRDGGADVEGVLVRALLDDLRKVLAALQGVVTALTNPATPPGTEVQNAAILTAMRTAADLPSVGLSAELTAMLATLATSKAGAGTAPYCAPYVRVQTDVTP